MPKPYPGNSLDKRFPHLVSEWCTPRNGGLKPADVTYGSIRKVWWTCTKGHAWRASPNDRTSRPRGCPVCSGHSVLPGFNDLATTRPDLVCDWHPSANGDLTPAAVVAGSTIRVWWQCHVCQFEWATKVCARALSNTGCSSCAGTVTVAGVNTLAVVSPTAAAMWVPSLNNGLTADQVHSGTNKRYTWRCPRGHAWVAPVNRMVSAHNNQPLGRHLSTTGCPVCGTSHNQHLTPRGTIAQEYPHLVTEWDFSRNDPNVTPDTVTAGSDRKIWWLCSLGHSWQAQAKSRCSRGLGCPYCSHRRVLPGYNDLATLDPALAACWHPTLNDTLTPEMVTPRSSKSVYWLCPQGHTSQGNVSAKVGSSLTAPTTLACMKCSQARQLCHHISGP